MAGLIDVQTQNPGINMEPPGEAPRQILVVDDVAENRDILSRRLRRTGYDVLTAENGREALAILSSTQVDLVLLDIMMPELDGFGVLERMKADETLGETPVIVISAVEEAESIARCITLGAEDYLPKPFDPVVLKARVGASLERKLLRDQRRENMAALKREKSKVDNILNAILPAHIAEELKSQGKVKPRRVDDACVLFSDVVGFTRYCDSRDPDTVFEHLDALVAAFEEVCADHGVEKIKTMGDGFMAAAGLFGDVESAVLRCAEAARSWISRARSVRPGWDVRVGIHNGPVMAGTIGAKRFTFDLWGDTVNTAARVESLGRVGCICFSERAAAALPGEVIMDGSYEVDAKGKGRMTIHFLSGA